MSEPSASQSSADEDSDDEFWSEHPGVYEPASFDELMTTLLDHGNPNLIYRGQSDFVWGLTCSLSRALRDQAKSGGPIPFALYESHVSDEGASEHARRMEIRVEQAFADMALRLSEFQPPPLEDRLAWWEIMQHYGAPTRLLDWTRSPLVGLWFTTWHAPPSAGDAALWVYNRGTSSLNHRPEIYGMDNQSEWKIDHPREWINRLAEAVVIKGGPVPLVVIPQSGPSRIAAQQSVLTLIPDVTLASGVHNHLLQSLTTKVRIKAEWRERIDHSVATMGLNEFSLFQDLDSLGAAVSTSLRHNLARPFP